MKVAYEVDKTKIKELTIEALEEKVEEAERNVRLTKSRFKKAERLNATPRQQSRLREVANVASLEHAAWVRRLEMAQRRFFK